MESVIYDGIDLGDLYTVYGVTRPSAAVTPAYELAPGGDRNMFRGADLVPPTIGFNLMRGELDERGRRDAARDLAAKLVRTKPVRVQFASDEGRYYMAMPEGPLDFHEFVRSGSMAVSLVCAEAAAYGRDGSANGAAGGTATFEVGGTYKTALRVTSAQATRDSSSWLWGVRLDEGEVQRVELPVATCAVEIDAGGRTAKANGTVAQVTLESDWFVVEPGTHTVRNDVGSGAFTVSWTERWL